MPNIGRRAFVAGSAAALLARSGPASAADYPDRPITLIIPFPPGGSTTIVIRSVSDKLAEFLGQQVVIDNRAGAGGTVGMTAVAKAAPNGYTIGATASSTIIATPLLNAQVPFDVATDFAFVSLLATVPMVLTVPSHLPIHNAAEFLKYVAANKDKLNYGSTAVGHYGHVALMEVSDSQGAGMVHSPYKGEAPLLQDILGGQLQCAFFAPSTARPSVDGGRLRMLGVSGTQRLKALPNVPTLLEQGWTAPVFRMNPGWVGVIAPARTPAAILQRLSAEYVAAIKAPEIKDKISEYGMAPVGANAEEFLAIYKAERPVWRELLTKAGLEIKGA